LSFSQFYAAISCISERVNQTIQTSLRKVIDGDQKDWDEKLYAVVFAYNSSVQSSTKVEPFQLMFARKAKLCLPRLDNKSHGDFIQDDSKSESDGNENMKNRLKVIDEVSARNEAVLRNISKVQEKQIRDYNKRRGYEMKFHVGDKVWMSNPRIEGRKEKMLDKNLGPYIVEKVLETGVVKLEGFAKFRNVSHLKKYVSPKKQRVQTKFSNESICEQLISPSVILRRKLAEKLGLKTFVLPQLSNGFNTQKPGKTYDIVGDGNCFLEHFLLFSQAPSVNIYC
jgi:hypothetical protein